MYPKIRWSSFSSAFVREKNTQRLQERRLRLPIATQIKTTKHKEARELSGISSKQQMLAHAQEDYLTQYPELLRSPEETILSSPPRALTVFHTFPSVLAEPGLLEDSKWYSGCSAVSRWRHDFLTNGNLQTRSIAVHYNIVYRIHPSATQKCISRLARHAYLGRLPKLHVLFMLAFFFLFTFLFYFRFLNSSVWFRVWGSFPRITNASLPSRPI